MNDGWVKAYRAWMDHPAIWRDGDHIAVWMYLQLNASHAQIPMMFAGEMITLQPRQLITGRYVISEKCRVQESKVKRILSEFEKYHLIDRQRSNKNSLITILPTDAERESDRQNDRQVTDNRPTSDRQVTTNKNERMKECKNVNNMGVPPSLDEVEAYCQERNSNIDPAAFFDYYTARGWKLAKGAMIKDWRACIRTWERRNKETGGVNDKSGEDQRKEYQNFGL